MDNDMTKFSFQKAKGKNVKYLSPKSNMNMNSSQSQTQLNANAQAKKKKSFTIPKRTKSLSDRIPKKMTAETK